MPCHEFAPGVYVCRPDGTTAPAKRRRKRWWCFTCRQHLLHTLMIWTPTAPSYYGPHTWWECPQCHQEDVLFPGREWVYPEEG